MALFFQWYANTIETLLFLILHQAKTLKIASFSMSLGTYKSEENQLLLKVYQVKGPTEHYYSKFKNDNWAMEGYVRQTDFTTFSHHAAFYMSLHYLNNNIIA